MQKLLVTPEEIILTAFTKQDQISPESISDHRIETTQLKFIAPVFRELYQQLCSGKYESFVQEYIKPALAYFVRYELITLLAVRVGDNGIIRINPNNSTPADLSVIDRLKQDARKCAELLLDQALEHINQNPADFPEFNPLEDGRKNIKITGGIII